MRTTERRKRDTGCKKQMRLHRHCIPHCLMGITIRSKNHNIDIGTGGLLRLRKTIASLTNKEISDHYNILLSEEYIHMVYHGFEEYDKKTEELYEKYKKEYGKVIDFLYASDITAKMTYGCAKQILKVIGDRTDLDDMVIGYAGWGEHAARFRDFRMILKDAAETKKGFGWR